MVHCAMLTTAVLLGLLPLALARPDGSSPLEDAVGAARLTGGGDHHHHRARRSAAKKWREWRECERERQCYSETGCGCCEDDQSCAADCEWNCRCGCGGYPPGAMDYRLWNECYKKRRCSETYSMCRDGCGAGEQGCEDSCILGRTTCVCECRQQAGNQTSTETSTSITTTRGGSATGDWNWRKYMACTEQSRECGRGAYGWLRELRRENSTCACMGLPGGDLDSYRRVEECLEQEDCRGREARCEDECRTDDCRDACRLGELRCRCGCNHRGRASLGDSVTTYSTLGTNNYSQGNTNVYIAEDVVIEL